MPVINPRLFYAFALLAIIAGRAPATTPVASEARIFPEAREDMSLADIDHAETVPVVVTPSCEYRTNG